MDETVEAAAIVEISVAVDDIPVQSPPHTRRPPPPRARKAPLRLIIQPTLPDGSENEIYSEWRPVFDEQGVLDAAAIGVELDTSDHTTLINSTNSDSDYVYQSDESDESDTSGDDEPELHKELARLADDYMSTDDDEDKEDDVVDTAAAEDDEQDEEDEVELEA